MENALEVLKKSQILSDVFIKAARRNYQMHLERSYNVDVVLNNLINNYRSKVERQISVIGLVDLK